MNKTKQKLSTIKNLVSSQLEMLIQPSTKRLVVGYSGGIDSTVLLYLLQKIIANYVDIKLLAVYVNHGLHKDASIWQRHCENICQQLSVEFKAIDTNPILSLGEGLEKSARDARFLAFDTILTKDDILCLGHHANDQTETVLFRLMRGAGVHGLAGIKWSNRLNNLMVFRPLLKIDKKTIKNFALDKKLNWIEDPSNDEDDYDRNFLRNKVIPVLEQRWPEIHYRLLQSSQLYHEQSILLDGIARSDSIELLATEGYLRLNNFRCLEKNRATNFMSWWLRKICGYSLSRERILNIYDSLINCRRDASFRQECGNQILIQSADRLFILPTDFFDEYRETVKIKFLLKDNTNNFSNEIRLQLGHYCQLTISSDSDKKLLAFVAKDYSIEFGITDTAVRLENKKHSTSIKNLFQQFKTPAWLKEFWPVLRKQKELVSILGFGIEQEFSDELQGVSFSCLFDWGQERHFEVTNKIL